MHREVGEEIMKIDQMIRIVDVGKKNIVRILIVQKKS